MRGPVISHEEALTLCQPRRRRREEPPIAQPSGVRLARPRSRVRVYPQRPRGIGLLLSGIYRLIKHLKSSPPAPEVPSIPATVPTESAPAVMPAPSEVPISIPPSPPKAPAASLVRRTGDAPTRRKLFGDGTTIADKVLAHLRANGPATVTDLWKATGAARRETVGVTILRLKNTGYLRLEGPVKERVVCLPEHPTPELAPKPPRKYPPRKPGERISDRIEAHLREHGPASLDAICAATGIPQGAAKAKSYRMQETQRLRREGPRGRRVLYLPDQAAPVLPAPPPRAPRAPRAEAKPKGTPRAKKAAPPSDTPKPRMPREERIEPVTIKLRETPPAPTPSSKLQPVEVSELRRRDQLFRCLPLACTLLAGACIDRQATAQGAPQKGASSEAFTARKSANVVARCRDCALGRSVLAAVQAHDGSPP